MENLIAKLILEEVEENLENLKLLKLLISKKTIMEDRVIINKLRPYDAKIEFTQSPEGIVQFSGYLQFDGTSPENIEEHARKLVDMFESAEKMCAERGYKLAKNVEEKEKKEPTVKEVK